MAGGRAGAASSLLSGGSMWAVGAVGQCCGWRGGNGAAVLGAVSVVSEGRWGQVACGRAGAAREHYLLEERKACGR